MTANLFHGVPDDGSGGKLFSENNRRKNLLGCHPCRIRPFIRIGRYLAARDLAPSFGAIGIFNANQNYPPLVSAAKAGLKEMNKRKIYFNKLDRAQCEHIDKTIRGSAVGGNCKRQALHLSAERLVSNVS